MLVFAPGMNPNPKFDETTFINSQTEPETDMKIKRKLHAKKIRVPKGENNSKITKSSISIAHPP